MKNDTLYNCCTEHREPDWNDFDALEIDCCASEILPDGSTGVPRCTEQNSSPSSAT
jgi:hypothetical protein